MDFSYTIDEYVSADSMLYVMYTPPVETGLLPRAIAIKVPAEVMATEDAVAIHQLVLDQAPVWDWILENNVTHDDHTAFMESLSGIYAVSSDPISHPDINHDVEVPDITAPVINNPGVGHNYFQNRLLTDDEKSTIVKARRKNIRREGFIMVYTYVNEHDPAFDPDVVGAPYDEQRVWIHSVHAEVQAKLDALNTPTDPYDVVFEADNHVPSSLEV